MKRPIIGVARRVRENVWPDSPFTIASILFELEPPHVCAAPEPVRFVVVSAIKHPAAKYVAWFPAVETMAFVSNEQADCLDAITDISGNEDRIADVLASLGYAEPEGAAS